MTTRERIKHALTCAEQCEQEAAVCLEDARKWRREAEAISDELPENRKMAANAVEAFHRYREKYPNESPAKLAGRITALWNNRPSVEAVRRWLNAAGIKVEDPKSRAECAKIARAVKSSPNGYRVIDADVWAANKSIFSSDDLAMLADGGLARIGLARDDEFDDWEAA